MIGKTNSVTCGAGFGHTIDFISDGNPYTRISVTDGQTIAKPSPDPTKSGLIFNGWNDGANNISFPYTPADDKVLTAHFTSVREGMILTEPGLICVLDGREYRKRYAGWSIAGYAWLATSSAPVLVALSAEAAEVIAQDYGSTGTGRSIVYHDITYYYCGNGGSVGGMRTSTATDVTDLYKCTDTSIAAAALTLVKRYYNEI